MKTNPIPMFLTAISFAILVMIWIWSDSKEDYDYDSKFMELQYKKELLDYQRDSMRYDDNIRMMRRLDELHEEKYSVDTIIMNYKNKR